MVWSPCSPRDSQKFSPAPNFKESILQHSAFFMVQLSHPFMTARKTIALTIGTFLHEVMSLLFNTLSRFHNFPSKEQASFNFMAAVTVHSDFGAQENKVCHCFHFSPSICLEMMGPDAMIFVFWMLSFKPGFSLSYLPLSLSSSTFN